MIPKIAKEWHPNKNLELRPEDVASRSDRKVWWLCPKGHEYDTKISHRTGENPTGCQRCYHDGIYSDNLLDTMFKRIG